MQTNANLAQAVAIKLSSYPARRAHLVRTYFATPTAPTTHSDRAKLVKHHGYGHAPALYRLQHSSGANRGTGDAQRHPHGVRMKARAEICQG